MPSFKYFVGIPVILPAVMIVMVLSAVNMGIATIAQAPATETLDGHLTANGRTG